MINEFEIIASNPPGYVNASVARAATRGGYCGYLSVENSDDEPARRVVRDVFDGRLEMGVIADQSGSRLKTLLKPAIGNGLTSVLYSCPDNKHLSEDVGWLKSQSLRTLVQVTNLPDALLAEKAGADAIVVKGNEAGGWVGEETTFILIQRVVPRVQAPVLARGGVGLHTAAACFAGGARGVVLDWQLALCDDATLPESIKNLVSRLDGGETIVLGQSTEMRCRAYHRPGVKATTALLELENSLSAVLGDTKDDPNKQREDWRAAVNQWAWAADQDRRLILVGQDACFAADLAERFETVSGVCDAMGREAVRRSAQAAVQHALDPGSPLAKEHTTRYPVVQGPMTRVSDTPEFAAAVAKGGGLPFLALALLRGERVGELLEQTKRQLGDQPWGVGVLGFVPRELRERQLEAIRKHPPPFAIIAGGRPDQALMMEKEGIRTYLHVPSPALLKLFLDSGARRVIFEGRECGGHVGPRSSFVLWNAMVDVMLSFISETEIDGSELQVLFAGGIHNSTSSSMVAAMAAPLVERGVRIGVLLGTSYLFTKEAVESGAILEGFQREAIQCDHTVLLETGIGHATRCADTPYGRHFSSEKARLLREEADKDKIRERLESMNLGRLRIASKGVRRIDGKTDGRQLETIDADSQRDQGMYMIGQVAALRDRVCTIEQLHEDVTTGCNERLARFASSPRNGRQVTPSEVAIVGMSCLFPKAENTRQYWENIVNKVNAVTEIPSDRWDWKLYFDEDRRARDKIYSKWGGFLNDIAFDPTRYGMPPNSLGSIEPMQLLVLETVRQALEDAGYDKRQFNRDRASVILGAGGGAADLGLGYSFRSLLPYYLGKTGHGAEDTARVIDEFGDSLPEWTEDSFAGLLVNVAAGRIANRFDFGGTNYTVDAACASSLAAVRVAVNELESGSSDLVVVGGADTMQSPFAYLCFSKTQALSPTGRCRTFDESADGIVIGEGIAMVVLKRLEDARRDGDRVYAVIKGVGSSSDGKARGLTAPRPAGQMRALDRAYEKAGFSPATVGLVEAHGTGTVAGDQSEVESLSRTLATAGAARQSCAVGSVKSMIGHTKCTAGVAGLIKTALALHNKVLPPTIGVTRPNAKADFSNSPLFVNTEPRPWIRAASDPPRRAGVSAFGFGGTNFHTVLEEYDDGETALDFPLAKVPWSSELILWRKNSIKKLVSNLEPLAQAISDGATPALSDLAAAVCREHGSASGSQNKSVCLAIVATSVDDLYEKLRRVLSRIAAGEKTHRDPRGIYFCGDIPPAGKVAMLFPGQGSQYPDMLGQLAIRCDVIRETFEQADEALGETLGKRLCELIFPRPVFAPGEHEENERALTQTRVAQPAIGAADMAMFRLVSRLGIHADMMGGHSYGEYAALCAGGAYGLEDLLHISEARGRLISASATNDPGTMAAIEADEATVMQVLEDIEGATIANLNGPSQTVIAGSGDAIDQVVKCFAERNIRARRIPVSCAFHSKHVAGACDPFHAVLKNVAFRTPSVAVFCNTTACVHQSDPDAIREQLVEHLVHPVRFADEILAMHNAGARIFIEVGPGKTLTGLAGAVLADRPHLAINLDQSGRDGTVQLTHALAQLAVGGLSFDPTALFTGRVSPRRDVAHLLREASPKALSPLTWMVNGARAIPLSKLNKSKAEAASARTNGRNPAGLSGQTDPDAKKAPPPAMFSNRSVSPPAKPPIGGQDPASLRSNARQPGDKAMGQSPQNQSAMAAYNALMGKFLETQKSVMLQFLRNQTGDTSSNHGEVVDPRSETPRPERIAEIKPQSTVQVESARQAPETSDTTPLAEPPTGTTEGSLREKVTDKLLEIVSDRTGYPPDMLDLDLDMEADLGIDSIKRVEILATLQKDGTVSDQSGEADIEVLSKLKTLRAIIDLLVDHNGAQDQEGKPASQPQTTSHSNPVATQADGEASIASAVPRMVVQTVNRDAAPSLLRGTLDGVVLIVGDDPPLAEMLSSSLRSHGVDAEEINGASVSDLADEGRAASQIADIRTRHGQIAAVIHLATDGSTFDPVTAFDAESIETSVLSLFHLLKHTEADLQKSGKVLLATRLGGTFGCFEDRIEGSTSLADRGLAGLVKSLAREWSGASCRAVDFEREASNDDVVRTLLAELTICDGACEIGYRGGRRIELIPFVSSLEPAPSRLSLDANSVVLITGGARGITAEIATELAQRFSPTLVLVGRSSLPEAQEPENTRNLFDAKTLKGELRTQLESQGKKATPGSVEKLYRALLKDRAIRTNLSAMKSAGATVDYRSVDVSDDAAFGDLLGDVYEQYGRIDGVIHGAGVTEDKLLRDKTTESFLRVLRPKVTGALTLARKLRGDSLKFLFFFSSVSARYGNRGQSDYAAANEVMNLLAHALNDRWKARVASLNWGPWEASGGMVSAELAAQFAKSGISMISRQAGRKAFVDELQMGGRDDVEVIYGGPLSTDSTPPQTATDLNYLPLLASLTRADRDGDKSITIYRTLDPAHDLYLNDHQLDGKPVMPMAVSMEMMTEVLAAGWANLSLSRLEELRVLRGVKLDNKTHTLRIRATEKSSNAQETLVDIRVESDGEKPTLHYTARAMLCASGATTIVPQRVVLSDAEPLSITLEEAYERWLFHGPLFAGIDHVQSISKKGLIATLSPSLPRRCLADGNGSGWIIDPVVVDSGLQLLILWTRTYLDMTGLPSRLGSYYRCSDAPTGPVRCEVKITAQDGPVLHADLMFYGSEGGLIGFMEDMEVACSQSLNRLAGMRSAGVDA